MLTLSELTAQLKLEFVPEDTGDSVLDFDTRVQTIAINALTRVTQTPPATDAQIEAGARWALLNAQLRQFFRASDSVHVGDVSIAQNNVARLAQLRIDLYAARVASNLDGFLIPARAKTIVAVVQPEF